MLVLNTTFPISSQASIDALLYYGNEWIRNSPYTKIKKELLRYKDAKNSYEVQKNGEIFEVIKERDGGIQLCGIRYKRNESGKAYWTTEVVGIKNTECFNVSIQVHCETSNYSYRPNAKNPYLIKLVHRNIGFAKDGTFPITNRPIYLKHDDIKKACSFINGEPCCKLPCVFVSINNYGGYDVSEVELANELLGIAHVFVEPNVYFSFDLRLRTKGKNAYNGAVGVYFPDSSYFHILMSNKKISNPKINKEMVRNKIRDALLLQQMNGKYTYSSIMTINYKRKMFEIERDGDKNLSEYMHNFDNELKEKKDEIEKLKSEILHLKHTLLSKQDVEMIEEKNALLYSGKVKENYHGESHDAIIDAIKGAMNNLPSNRRKMLLQKVVESNQLVGIKEKIASELKKILKGYSSMTPVIKGKLQRLGLCIEEGGKHYKLFFKENPEYFATLVKTGSDHRGGLNAARDIIRQLL